MLTSIELFAGAGGLALGLERSGFHCLALNENDPSAVKTLKANRNDWRVLDSDIRETDFSGIIPQGQLDLLSGGFPCQPFSHAGKKRGFEDARGTLFFEFVQVIVALKPKVVLLENVRGITQARDGKPPAIEVIESSLQEAGYESDVRVLNALDYGVPQKRVRTLIVAVRADLADKAELVWPKPQERVVTIGEALQGVPHSQGTTYSEAKRQVLDLVPPGGCWRDLPIEVQKEYMGSSFYLTGGKTGMARRLAWDEPCLTLTCSPAQKQTERCHPEETRPLTVREYARLQTFPDEWVFEGSLTNQYKQIGNAVPVKMAQAMGESLARLCESIR